MTNRELTPEERIAFFKKQTDWYQERLDIGDQDVRLFLETAKASGHLSGHYLRNLGETLIFMAKREEVMSDLAQRWKKTLEQEQAA